jgi:hypothetical protein
MTHPLDELNYDWLTSAEEVLKAQRKAEQEVSGFTSDEYQYIRNKSKNDLFFLNHFLLGYTRLSPMLHGHLSSWAEKHDSDQFREFLLPRGHFKSTVLTIGDGIRIALPDDLGGSVWPRNLGTNARICIGHEVVDTAARFLFSISGHFLHNPKLMGFFPECIPDKRRHRINKFELELPRTEIWNEPTFDTIGVGGASQGKHYNFLKLDDLFGEKARDSAAERRRAIDWFDNIQSLFSTFEKDHFDLIGTRWAIDDLYAHAHEIYGSDLVKYIRSCEEQGVDGTMHTIFPEEFTPKKLEILKRNRKIYSAQYANNPKVGSGEFQENWIKYYHWTRENVLSVHGENLPINVRTDTDNCIFIDPATTGLGSFVVTAEDFKERIFIVEARKKVWSPPELVEDIFTAVQRWQPRVVVIEAVLFSIVYQHWIEREMRFRGISFRIEPGKTRNRQKEDRVRGLVNYYTAGQIFYGHGQVELIEEHNAFGTTENYHILDALAYGPEHWRKPTRRVMDQRELAAQSLSRDKATGYSKQ